MVSEITEVWDEDAGFASGDDETRKQRIRQIIRYQKSLCGPSVTLSSSSSSSSLQASSSYSSVSSSGRNEKLLELMKGGAYSLKRLFDMDHDAQLSMVSPHLERGCSSHVEVSDSPATSRRPGPWRRRDVLDKVPKLSLFSRFQRIGKWRRWRKSGFRLRFRRLRIRICWSKH